MNIFLKRLEKALKNLSDNPKPQCEGFYLAFYSKFTNTMTVEKIGIVPEEKVSKYFQLAVKKVMQTLFFKAVRSKDFEDYLFDQYPGAMNLINGCTGVSGHDSMIDEAISALWLVYKYVCVKPSDQWLVFLKMASSVQRKWAPDNKWITILAERVATG